jgi:hypothetical protein
MGIVLGVNNANSKASAEARCGETTAVILSRMRIRYLSATNAAYLWLLAAWVRCDILLLHQW